MAQPLNTAYGQFMGQDDKEFYNELWEQGNDFDRPGAEGMCDIAQIYYDYYFNDERRWDNPEGWDPEDPYWHGPDCPTGICPTIQKETILSSDYYSAEDWEEYEMDQEYEALEQEYSIGDNWRYIVQALADREGRRQSGIAWREENT